MLPRTTHTPIPLPALLTLIVFMLPALSSVAAAETRSGDQVYQQVCAGCHASGVANAPRYGAQEDWEELIEEGQEVLTAHGWVGIRGMPPRGGRPDLPLEQFAAAVAYMARSAGADWQAPDPAMLAGIREEITARKSELAAKK